MAHRKMHPSYFKINARMAARQRREWQRALGPRCYGCGRHPRTCWIMPCLVLEVANAQGIEAVKAWGRKSGLEVRS